MAKIKDHPQRPKAGTLEILGKPFGTTDIPEKWESHFNKLENLLDDFTNQRRDLVKDAAEERPGYSMHMADAGTDTYDQDLALSMLSSDQSLVVEIEAAMVRIRDGSYGICDITGREIEPDRLEAIPWTRYSLAAVQKLEAEGKVTRTRLADRGSWDARSTGEESGTGESNDEGGATE